MAVHYRLVVIGILCLTLLHQALSGCRSCESSKSDKDCRDLYKPKNELEACVMTKTDKTQKNLCKLYKKGWKIICDSGQSSWSCKGPCPRNSAVVFTQDVTTVVVVVSTILSLQRLLH